MAPKGAAEGRGVGVHVVHALIGVAQIADGGVFESRHGPQRQAPLPDLLPGVVIAVEIAHDHVGGWMAQANHGPGYLGQSADIVIGELHVSGGVLIIKAGHRLQRDQDDGHIQIECEGRRQRRCHIGGQQDEYAVHIHGLEPADRLPGSGDGVYESCIAHLGIGIRHGDEYLGLVHEFFSQSRELGPVGFVSHRYDADSGFLGGH